MSLNIKNEEAERLVEALSGITGESKTQATIAALRERLERERRIRNRKALSAEFLAIGRRCAGDTRRGATDHGAFLYDERGLPG